MEIGTGPNLRQQIAEENELPFFHRIAAKKLSRQSSLGHSTCDVVANRRIRDEPHTALCPAELHRDEFDFAERAAL